MMLNDSEMLTVSKAAKYLFYPSWLLLQWLKCNLLSLLAVASFPGPFHRQCLIACSMEMQREKAWEIWSCGYILRYI